MTKYIKLSTFNSVSSSNVKVGKFVYLTSKITNTGKDTSNLVQIKTTLPNGVKLVSESSSKYYNKKTNTWTFTILAGKTYTFTTKVKITTKGTHKVTINNGNIKSYNIKGA